jgi:hypothetical protein
MVTGGSSGVGLAAALASVANCRAGADHGPSPRTAGSRSGTPNIETLFIDGSLRENKFGDFANVQMEADLKLSILEQSTLSDNSSASRTLRATSFRRTEDEPGAADVANHWSFIFGASTLRRRWAI